MKIYGIRCTGGIWSPPPVHNKVTGVALNNPRAPEITKKIEPSHFPTRWLRNSNLKLRITKRLKVY